MNLKMKKMIAFALVLATLCSVTMPVFASDRSGDSDVSVHASEYLNAYSAGITAGTGSVTVSFSVTATGYMTSLGASRIDIYTSSGSLAKTFYGSTTNGMLVSNKSIHAASMTYSAAKSGTKYYAVVTVKASNANGGDSRSVTSGYATAK